MSDATTPQETPTPIAHAEVVAKLDYRPSTGDFFWEKDGSRAGFLISAGRYFGIRINGRTYRSARLAWFYVHGKWPSGHIDHIDGNAFNDAIENLRDVTQRENNSNLAKHRGGKLVGACHWPRHCKSLPWMARIKINGKDRRLGHFSTEQEAHEAYLKAKQELAV